MENTLKLLLILSLSILVLPMMAQFPPPPAAPNVPIDGGLLSVVGAGIVYGVNKYRKVKKKK